MLTEMCTQGLCLPPTKMSLPPTAASQQQPNSVDRQLSHAVAPQEQLETVQHDGSTTYICKLQVSFYTSQLLSLYNALPRK